MMRWSTVRKMKLPESFLFEAGPRAVLLLHAYTGSANDVRLLGRELQRHNYTVYAPQFKGHASERFEDILDEGSPDKWFADVVEATRYLKEKGYEEIAVMGLSMGGIMATRALEVGDYIGGGSFNSPIHNVGETRLPETFISLYRSFNKRMGVPDERIQDRIPRIKTKRTQQLEEIAGFSKKVAQNLNQINVPYYIASSGNDELIDPANGQLLKEALMPYTEVDYHEFPELSHVITVGPNRESFETTVIAFLNKLNWKEG